MAGKEYKQLNCRDAGADCDFLVRAETEDELIRIVSDHGCRVHGLCEFSSELESQVRSHIQIVMV
jgi:predicted small metal-binding protein